MIQNVEKSIDLKTELLKEAFCINTKNPSFSWVLNNSNTDDVQTAYRVFISKTNEIKRDVHDTGWIESNESSFVHVPELQNKLIDNQLYYWQVQTKNKEGIESEISNPSPFMTNISSEWISLNGIWAVPSPDPPETWTNYSIETKLSIQTGNALGILIRIDNDKNGYLVQFRDLDNIVKFHVINKGTIDTTAFSELKLSEFGITLPTDKSEFKIFLTVFNDQIQLKIDTGSCYQNAGTVSLEVTAVMAGKIGFRTGRTESGNISALTVKDSSEKVLYQSDFEQDDGYFEGCDVSNGKLFVDKSVFSVLKDPNHLHELGNFTFIRSPKLFVSDIEKVDKAVISAASRGTSKDRGTIFDLFFNGECIGAGSAREMENVGGFSSSENNGYTQVYYNSYDVTDLLGEGDQNVISAVGNCGDPNRGILIQMTVFQTDGTKEILTNSGAENSGWKTLDGTSAFGDVGETIPTGYVNLFHDNINMEAYPVGWNSVNFDTSNWKIAQVNKPVADRSTGDSGRVLYPYPSENVLRHKTSETAKKMYINNDGNVVIDLGKEIIGGLKVNFESKIHQKITVFMGEEMENGGHVKHKLSAGPDYVDHWTLRAGKNEFETITFRNFRYVELIGLDEVTKKTVIQDLNTINGWAVYQKFDEEDSYFESSGVDEALLLNLLYELSKYTIKATNQDVFVDSQARERAPYEGDLLVNSNTSYSVRCNYSLARHSNEWLIDNPTWPNDYSLFSVEMAYWDYMYTGNSDSLRRNFDSLKKKLKIKVASEDHETGLIYADSGGQAGHTALIDWPVRERDGYTESHYDVILNAEYVAMYRYMSMICEALNKSDEAIEYNSKSEKLKKTLINFAYDRKNGCFYDSLSRDLKPTQHSSTHASAYSLCYGVFEGQEMADSLCNFVFERCKIEFKGSVYASYFILKGLFIGNHGELALKLLTNERVGKDVKTFVSLLIDLKCTITPEAWGHKHKENMTLSHPWGASPGCSIVQGMFGILPLKAGFSAFSIKLQPGGIPMAKIKVPTVKGPIFVSYKNGSEPDLKDNKLNVEVEIPPNSRAVLHLPAQYADSSCLIVDGVITDAIVEDCYLKVEVGSGKHTFSISQENKSHCLIF